MDMMLFKRSDNLVTPLTVGGVEYDNVDTVGEAQGCPFDAGLSEYTKGRAVEFDHADYCCAIYMIDGVLDVTENSTGGTIHAESGDVFYIPQSDGLKVTFSTPDHARIFWICYPHWH